MKVQVVLGTASLLMFASAQAVTLNLAGVTIDGVTPAVAGEGSLTGSTGGTAIFGRSDYMSSGTGVIDPFLIIQQKGNEDTEEGYNTDGTLTFDTKQSNFTRDLQLSELATVLRAGVNYYQFSLNANQDANGTTGKAPLSIDEIKIYTSPTASISTETLADLGTLRFDLGNNSIFLDAAIGSTAGGGSDDMFALIPVQAFNGAATSDYLYFYNKNGEQLEANAGAEQWSALLGESRNVPDGGTTLTLIGSAISALALLRRKLT